MTPVLLLVICGGNIHKQIGNKIKTDSIITVINGMKTLHLDSMQVTWIQDNNEDYFISNSIFSDTNGIHIKDQSFSNGIPSSISSFLVKMNGIQILFDTGYGFSDSKLLIRLQELGISPEDMMYIYITHFHRDHIGGLMHNDSVVFPNAEVYASKKEYDAWINMPLDKKSQVVKTMNAYKKRLHLFEFGDTLPGKVLAMNAIGHTPGHTVYRIGKLLIIVDLIHGAAFQYEYPEICASFDMDKNKAIQSRKYYLQYAKENNLIIAGMHLPAPAFKYPLCD